MAVIISRRFSYCPNFATAPDDGRHDPNHGEVFGVHHEVEVDENQRGYRRHTNAGEQRRDGFHEHAVFAVVTVCPHHHGKAGDSQQEGQTEGRGVGKPGK